MHSSCLLFFSVADLLFTVSFTTIVSMYANVTESYFTTTYNFIALAHHCSSLRSLSYLAPLSYFNWGWHLPFSYRMLIFFGYFFCADCLLLFWTRVVARLLRGKTCRGVTFISLPQIPRHGQI